MLKLYKVDPKTLDKECVAYLGDAYEVELEQRINDIESLYFNYPYTDEKAAMIEENMIVSCEGRDYITLKVSRKTKGSDIVEVTATDVFSTRGKAKHIQNIPDMIGVKPSKVFEKILEGTKFEMFTETELQERGMTWIDRDGYLIDFFSVDKTNVWEATRTLIENCGKGEIYRDNMKVAIVKRIGQDNGVRLTLEHNLDGLDIMRDFEGVITRLYPYGASDMHIGSINGGKQYIDSPMIEKYGIIEGCKNYSDYTDPAKIKAHAEWEFDPENENRIDIPEIKIIGGFIDLAKLPEVGDIEKVEIGDLVHVYDNDHNVYHQRVVALKSYPYEPKMPTIEIGHMDTNFFSIIYNLCQRRRELESVQTTNKSITTRKMQGVVNTDRNEVQSDNKLLQIIGDLLTIYQKKDKKTNKRLQLGNVGGDFTLNIYDEDGETLRVRLGDEGKKYSFAIYDNNGNAAIYMDENGEVRFAGKVETDKIASIGQELIIGAVDENVSKIIMKSGELNSTDIINDDTNKVFKISPAFGGDLVIDESWIKFRGAELATVSGLNDIKSEIEKIWEAINA